MQKGPENGMLAGISKELAAGPDIRWPP